MGPLLFVVSVVVVEGCVVALVWRRARGRTAIGIARRLRDAEAEYVVRLGSYRQTWNPARALGATNGLFGPGVARYRLDADGLVSLDWRPHAGAVQHLVGPLPPVAIPGTAAYRARQAILRPVKVVLGGYCAMLALGCVLGYVLAGGSTNSRLKLAYGEEWPRSSPGGSGCTCGRSFTAYDAVKPHDPQPATRSGSHRQGGTHRQRCQCHEHAGPKKRPLLAAMTRVRVPTAGIACLCGSPGEDDGGPLDPDIGHPIHASRSSRARASR